MILFGSPLSPFVRKTMAYAAEKGIKYELRTLGLGSDDPDFLASSPFRKIPAMRDGDFRLADSTAIIAYLEAKHPEPNLIPTAAEARGRTIWFEEFVDTVLVAAAGKMFFNRIVAPMFLKREGDMAAADSAERDELPPLLAYAESQIPASGFLVEDRLTLADLALASVLVNIDHCSSRPFDSAAHPKLAAFKAAMHARPSFAATIAGERKVLGK